MSAGLHHRSALETASLQQDPRWAIARAVTSSSTFSKSARLSQFLLYICECAILGRLDEVTEQRVGVAVFDRSPDYNPGEDNIVRTHARLLRRKLEEYYAAEGKSDPIRLLVPKGGYVPVFEELAAPERAEVEVAAAPASRLPRWWIAAAVALLAVAAGMGVYQRIASRTPAGRVRQFWSQLFDGASPALIIPSDTAFVLYQSYTGRNIALAEYSTRAFWQNATTMPGMPQGSVTGLSALPYTNLVDLEFCWWLARNPYVDLRKATIRRPRELQPTDLRGMNVVLIGARRANPWVELFDQKSNFQGLFDQEKRDYIVNKAPQNGEPPIYRHENGPSIAHSYAVVSFVPGLTGKENVLILSGLNTPGTAGAGDFLGNTDQFGALLSRIAGSQAEIPHFEVVLEVESLANTAPRAKPVAYRIRTD